MARSSNPWTIEAGRARVSWLIDVTGRDSGEAIVKAALESNDNNDQTMAQEQKTIVIQPLEPRLFISSTEPVHSGKPFWVAALVQHAPPDQNVELSLPDGLHLASNEAARNPVP
jgi:hypothetical protein